MSLLHPDQNRLALYAGSDLGPLDRLQVGWHVRGCAECRRAVNRLNSCRVALRDMAEELPPELAVGEAWDRMARDMTANIRLGLAAGECVSAVGMRPRAFSWQMAAIAVGLMFLIAAAWVLNRPFLPGPHDPVLSAQEVTLTATPAGVELRENGRALTLVHGKRPEDATYVSTPDSLRARYVNSETGQVVINTVYAQ